MIRTAAPFARSLPQEKIAPEKNTTKRKVPITEEVIKKRKLGRKRKKIRRPAALTLQFCRK